MKRFLVAAGAIAVISAVATIPVGSASAADQPGETLFKQHCAACHPGGGNIINPQKTLQKKVREANNIKTVDDIIKLMRNPGPGMTTFDTKTIPDKDAKQIANYILNAFK
jgi:cytochrome c6